MRMSSFLIALLVVAIWGLNAAIGKVAVMQMPAVTFLVIRFTIVGLMFLPFAKLKKGDLKKLLIFAMFMNVLHYGFVFSSMKFLDASSVAILQQTQVPFAVLLGWILLKEKVTTKTMIGIFLGIAGLLVVLGSPTVTLIGGFLVILSSLFWGISNIKMKGLKDINIFAFIAYPALFSLPFLIMFALVYDDVSNIEWNQINYWEISLVMFYQVVIGSIAMFIWQRLLKSHNINKVVSVTLLQPIFGIIGGIIIFGDKLNSSLIIGGLIIAFSLYLIMKDKEKKNIEIIEND